MRSAIGLGLIMTLMLVACAQAPRASSTRPVLSGQKAMEYVRAQVAFGPRPPGSPALEKCRNYLRRQLKGFGYQKRPASS